MPHENKTVEFPMAAAKGLVQDLFTPNPFIYWLDFLFFAALGWFSFGLCVRSADFSTVQVAAFFTAGFALYRAVIFVHELTHLKKGTFRVFHLVWNLLCGFPLMVPSMLYMGVHIDHHKQKLYGTRNDHEYFDFALEKPYRIPLFLAGMLVAPALFLIRFCLLTPLSYILQPLRKPLWEMASSLAVGGGYKRPAPTGEEKHLLWAQEFMAFLYSAMGLALMAKGLLPWKVLGVWYLAAIFILLTNGLRTLVAHCYKNPPGHEMSFSEQMLDSINIPGNRVFTPLWAPVGLRFHATHHLFPAMPYHHLGKAHRRLLKGLPEGNLYAQTIRKGFWNALVRLWRESAAHQRAKTHRDS